MPGAALAIVVLNYNTCGLLAACLASIQKHASAAQVIVVDNASSDGSAEMVAREFPQAILIANDANLGFARAINAGVRRAAAPYILTLNADTELLPTTIEPLVETMRRMPRAGIIAPQQCLPNPASATQPGRLLATAFPDPTLEREARRLLLFGDSFAARLKLGPWKNISGAPRAADYLIGAALLFRRECWDKIGGFDETQFMYGEDWDICFRARQAGWQVYLVPDAKIVHHENASGNQSLGGQRIVRVLEANLYFHEKHFGRASRRILGLLNLVGGGLRLALFGLMGRLPQARAQIELARVAWRAIWSR